MLLCTNSWASSGVLRGRENELQLCISGNTRADVDAGIAVRHAPDRTVGAIAEAFTLPVEQLQSHLASNGSSHPIAHALDHDQRLGFVVDE